MRAISLDLDNTLIDRDAAAAAWWAARLRSVGVSATELAPLLAPLLALDAHGHGPRDVLFGTAAARFPGLGSPVALWQAFRAEIATWLLPDPAVVALVHWLAGRYKLALLTDGSVEVQEAKLCAAGLAGAFDVVLISEATGVRKPHRRAFHNVALALNVSPRQILHVGDHPLVDADGAVRAGLRAGFVCAPPAVTQAPAQWPLSTNPPHFVLSSVLALPSALGATA